MVFFGGNYGGPGSHDGPEPSSTSGLKDSTARAILLGAVLPAAILILVIHNLVSGQAYCFGGRGDPFIVVYTKFWFVLAASTLELGAAGVLITWYGLANVQRFESWCEPAGIVSAVILIVGVILLFVSFFR
jgi:hypothetical protein